MPERIITISPIQTDYRGYRFRSRLEARWAVAFDAMQLDWRYEPEGFHLPSGRFYLPDFLIRLKCSTGRLWIEIKPAGGDIGLFEEFICACPEGDEGIVLGDIPDPETETGIEADIYGDCLFIDPQTGEKKARGWKDNFYEFCACPHCGTISLQFEARAGRISCCPANVSGRSQSDRDHDPVKIRRAYRAARSARFEHGETGLRRAGSL